MAVTLTKGGRVNLTKGTGLKSAMLGLGWDTNRYEGKADFDLDLVLFMCGADGKCVDESHMIFYGNKQDPDGSVVHSGDNRTGVGDGDDETATVTFEKIPDAVTKIVAAVTIYEAKANNQNFGLVDNAYIRVVNQDTGEEVLKYDLGEDFSIQTSVVFAELYKQDGEWKFKAVGEGYAKELVDLCHEYGVEVA
ncbi:MAG: TerD family protein [Clostridiales bacterium]|nr:TerD family protein [Clostridiales bacterium]